MKRDTLDDAPASGSVGPSGSSSTDVTVLPRSNRPLYLLGAVLGFGLFLVVLNFDDSGAEPQTIDPEVEGAARPAATPELAARELSQTLAAEERRNEAQRQREAEEQAAAAEAEAPPPTPAEVRAQQAASARDQYLARREELRYERRLEAEQRSHAARLAALDSSMVIELADFEGAAPVPGFEGEGEDSSTTRLMAMAEQRLSQLTGSGGGGVDLSGLLGAAAGGAAGGGANEQHARAQRRGEFFASGGEQLPSGVLTHTRQPALSPYILSMGSVIPGTLVTGIVSDLPGQILGQVDENVFDTSTGRHLLIPQGSQLVGTYNAEVTSGQARVQIAWTRINFPDGSTLDLEGMAGADRAGYSGFHDQVNRHIGRRLGLALLLTVFNVGQELSGSFRNPNTWQGGLQRGIGDSVYQFGTQAVQDELQIPPTLTIRPGYGFQIMVSKDIVFPGAYVALEG